MRLSLRCVPFSRPNLFEELRKAACLAPTSEPDQIKYLFLYLANDELGARTLIIEHPYIDRHYLEEFTGYYANTLRAPSQKTTRIHIFSSNISDADLQNLITKAKEDYENVCKNIERDYIGFIVVRPFAGAPIGRTVIRPYRKSPSRCFAAAETKHRVHLAGLELKVEGVPFQQQDQAVGACATTAIWSALARVMRADGGRAVTPLAVTASATKYVLHGRALPANNGLDINQIFGAIREFGYSPYSLSIRNGKVLDEFQLAIKCYLQSGIPVILRIRHDDSDEAHAVTVVGFRKSDESTAAKDLVIKVGTSYELRSLGMSRLYLHDDRLGPYVRAVWTDPDKENPTPQRRSVRRRTQPTQAQTPPKNNEPILQILPNAAGFEKFSSKAYVWNAIAPLYPKLRLTAEDLIGYAGELLPFMTHVVGQEDKENLKVELRFALGGQYLRELYSLNISADRVKEFATTIFLSRYVGIIRFLLADQWLADIVYDTTDIRRDIPVAPILGTIACDAKYKKLFDSYIPSQSSSDHLPIIV